MTETRGAALWMEWIDVDVDVEARFDADAERDVVERFGTVPGVLAFGRYIAVEGAPKYLTMVEVEDHHVLASRAFGEATRHRRHAGPSSLADGRRYLRLGYRQIYPTLVEQPSPPRGLAPFVQLGRIDIPASREEEFNAWYNTAYIPPYLKIAGCLSARRYRAIDGEPRYLTLYELANPEIRHSEPWKRARTSNPWSARFHPLAHGVGSPGVYRRVHP